MTTTPKAPTLPKTHELRPLLPILEKLAAFASANEAYQHDGWDKIRAVIDYVTWAGNNQHLPRRIDS